MLGEKREPLRRGDALGGVGKEHLQGAVTDVNADGEIRGAGERYRLRAPAGAHRRRGLHHARSLKALDQVRDGGWRQAGRGGKLDLRDLTIDPHRLDDAGRVGFAQRRLRLGSTAIPMHPEAFFGLEIEQWELVAGDLTTTAAAIEDEAVYQSAFGTAFI